MEEQDNPQVGADATGTEGQTQDTTLLGQEQTAAPVAQETTETDWRASLPDDLKSAKSLQSIKSVEDLAKGFVNAQSVIGRRFEDLTDDQKRDYYSTMGRPEDASGYELQNPEGLEVDKDMMDWYRSKAHEYGLPKEAAEKLYQDYVSKEMEGGAKLQELQAIQMKEQVDQLKKDFGPAFNERVTLANRALKEFGGEEAVAAIAQSGLANHPALVKLLANAGETLAEGKFTSGSSTGKFGMTSEEATRQIDSLRRDPEFMKHYANPASPKHKEAAEKLQDFYKIKVNASTQ